MIVIGADTHKGSHALAAVDEGTGRARGSREIKADEQTAHCQHKPHGHRWRVPRTVNATRAKVKPAN